MTLWHVLNVGCVAIWPVTAPKEKSNQCEVAMLALPEEHSVNPGKKAHEAEGEVGQFGSGA